MVEIGKALGGLSTVSSFVPGIGTAISAFAGAAAGFFPGEEQVLNAFKAPGYGFAGGLYDPPNEWRPGEVASIFKGLLWGRRPSQWDVNEARRREAVQDPPSTKSFGFGSAFEKPIVSPGSWGTVLLPERYVAETPAALIGGLRAKGIYEKDVVDADQFLAHLDRVKAWNEHRPQGLDFWYLGKEESWSTYKERRFEAARRWALTQGTKFARTVFGSTQWLPPFQSMGQWLAHKSNAQPGVLQAEHQASNAKRREPWQAEIEDWNRYQVALQMQADKAAFIAEAQQAAAAAYEHYLATGGALGGSQGGFVIPSEGTSAPVPPAFGNVPAGNGSRPRDLQNGILENPSPAGESKLGLAASILAIGLLALGG